VRPFTSQGAGHGRVIAGCVIAGCDIAGRDNNTDLPVACADRRPGDDRAGGLLRGQAMNFSRAAFT
jgi:hypothetical protein